MFNKWLSKRLQTDWLDRWHVWHGKKSKVRNLHKTQIQMNPCKHSLNTRWESALKLLHDIQHLINGLHLTASVMMVLRRESCLISKAIKNTLKPLTKWHVFIIFPKHQGRRNDQNVLSKVLWVVKMRFQVLCCCLLVKSIPQVNFTLHNCFQWVIWATLLKETISLTTYNVFSSAKTRKGRLFCLNVVGVAVWGRGKRSCSPRAYKAKDVNLK